jgi:hypothetical protein
LRSLSASRTSTTTATTGTATGTTDTTTTRTVTTVTERAASFTIGVIKCIDSTSAPKNDKLSTHTLGNGRARQIASKSKVRKA